MSENAEGLQAVTDAPALGVSIKNTVTSAKTRQSFSETDFYYAPSPMKILYLHGWQSVPGGVKPTHLSDLGHDILEPRLPDEDFDLAVCIAEDWHARNRPDVVVGSSRGGAVAVNMDSGESPMVLLCPAWKRWGSTTRVKAATVILHAIEDDVIPFGDSLELMRNSGLPETALIITGSTHRLADPDSLTALALAVARVGTTPKAFPQP